MFPGEGELCVGEQRFQRQLAMIARRVQFLKTNLYQYASKRRFAQIATSSALFPHQSHLQQHQQHGQVGAAGSSTPSFLQQQTLKADKIPTPTKIAGASVPWSDSAHSVSESKSEILRDEEATILTYAKKRSERVSLRSLAEVGLGTRPWLSSLRDAMSLENPLCSLNVRLCRVSDPHSPAQKGLLRMATFLHRELPIRFARGITFIDKLDSSRQAPSLRVVREWYRESFRDAVSSPCPVTDGCEESFVKVLTRVRDRHADELLLVARGVFELRAKLGMDGLDGRGGREALHAQLDELHLKRIALRILVGHYLALHQPPRPNYVGIICTRTKLQDVIETAAADARWICKQRFDGCAPRVEVIGGEGMVMACIPESLYYLSMELIKNSLRAVAERYSEALFRDGSMAHGAGGDEGCVPSIKVILSREYSLTEGQQVVIEVRDEGGGIPPEDLGKVFCYLFSTAADADVQQLVMDRHASGLGGERSKHNRGNSKKVPLAGLGYGLGIAKSYALYFGGELEIKNRPGDGCSVFVTLSRLGECKEPLV